MNYRADHSYDVGNETYDEDEDEPRRGLLSWILIIALLMGTGSGSALIWRTFGGGPILPSYAAGTTAIADVGKPSGQGDLSALRQEITGSVQSTQQLLAAQQAEIRRLSDQVSALSSKLEMLQRPVTSAQGAMPAPAPRAVAPTPKKRPDTAKSAEAKPAEAKPAEAKTADVKPGDAKPINGPISTGGAPLQSKR